MPRRQGLRNSNAGRSSGALSSFLGRCQGVPGGQGVGLYNARDMLAAVRRL